MKESEYTEQKTTEKSARLSKDVVPQDYTVGLALVDAVPVLLFGATMILVWRLFGAPLFLVGVLLCLFGGVVKVIWKLIVAVAKKNIWWMFVQMRITMPIGFVLMLVAVIASGGAIDWAIVGRNMLALPQAICFGIGFLGMILMIVFSVTLNNRAKNANWIEQLTNSAAQFGFFLGVLFILIGA